MSVRSAALVRRKTAYGIPVNCTTTLHTYTLACGHVETREVKHLRNPRLVGQALRCSRCSDANATDTACDG